MNAIKAYYDGNVFIPIGPVKAKKNQPAIITMLDDGKKDDKPHLKFIGTLSQDSFDEINLALMETQRIDSNEW